MYYYNILKNSSQFCSVALDIIGKSVFNYDFGSVTKESPVIKAVYSALVETEHRSMTPAPYWKIPGANVVVPRLRKFQSNLKTLDDTLNELIGIAKDTRQVEDIEELENRDYANVKDPSLLRFLVDMRGGEKRREEDTFYFLSFSHSPHHRYLFSQLISTTSNFATT